jgi:hypothetical protein
MEGEAVGVGDVAPGEAEAEVFGAVPLGEAAEGPLGPGGQRLPVQAERR